LSRVWEVSEWVFEFMHIHDRSLSFPFGLEAENWNRSDGVDDEVDCNSTREATRPFPFPLIIIWFERASELIAATSGIGRLLLSSTLSKRAFKMWILE
jgi:hypothetical protein